MSLSEALQARVKQLGNKVTLPTTKYLMHLNLSDALQARVKQQENKVIFTQQRI